MAHDFNRFPELTNAQMQLYYFESPHKQITEDFSARVIKVSDGDTIRVTTKFRDFDFPIRFSNTNAPELNEPNGEESKEWLTKQIMNEEIDIILDKRRVDKWGRLLGEIMFRGLSINEESIRTRHAIIFGEESGQIPELNRVIKDVIKFRQ